MGLADTFQLAQALRDRGGSPELIERVLQEGGSVGLGDIFGAVIGGVGGALLGGPAGAALGASVLGGLFGGDDAAMVPQPGQAGFVGPVAPTVSPLQGIGVGDAAAALLQQVLSTATLGAVPGAAPLAAAALSTPAAASTALAAPGGNGSRFRTTIVITRETDTNRILRTEILKGAPFLMNNDVRKLSAISRKVSKANSKIPRKTVRESATTQLKNAAIDSALRNTLAICPPKPC